MKTIDRRRRSINRRHPFEFEWLDHDASKFSSVVLPPLTLILYPPGMELPHTAGCMVCGRQNPFGLRLSLHVDETSGVVTAEYVPQPQHIGFEGIIHGGILSTVLDEAMVWAATWAGKRFCVAGELNVRFRQSASPGKRLWVTTKVESVRSRLIETVGDLRDEAGQVIASATGKYLPVSADRNQFVLTTFVDEPETARAAGMLRSQAIE